jgi:hypothetical protein
MKVSTKKSYTKPEIIFEMDLETRAGSTIELIAPLEDPNPDLDIEP